MGSCHSCYNREEDKYEIREFCLSLCCCVSVNKSQNGEPNERTTLLGNPVSNSHNYNTPLFSGDNYISAIPDHQAGDQQSTLNRILHQTARDVIDVSAIPTHLERKEYLDRIKLYEQKLFSIQPNRLTKEQSLILKDVPHPDRVLSESPLTFEDFKLVGECFNDLQKSMQEIKVHPHMDLVAQFGSS